MFPSGRMFHACEVNQETFVNRGENGEPWPKTPHALHGIYCLGFKFTMGAYIIELLYPTEELVQSHVSGKTDLTRPTSFMEAVDADEDVALPVMAFGGAMPPPPAPAAANSKSTAIGSRNTPFLVVSKEEVAQHN